MSQQGRASDALRHLPRQVPAASASSGGTAVLSMLPRQSSTSMLLTKGESTIEGSGRRSSQNADNNFSSNSKVPLKPSLYHRSAATSNTTTTTTTTATTTTGSAPPMTALTAPTAAVTPAITTKQTAEAAGRRSENDPKPKPIPPPGFVPITTDTAASHKNTPMTAAKWIPVMVWRCGNCSGICNVMKSENRCICGHRFREHQTRAAAAKVLENHYETLTGEAPSHQQEPSPAAAAAPRCPCTVAKCACKNFFYMVAEGAWILRCRCKHKHVEHDPNPPYKCLKCPPSSSLRGGAGVGKGGCSGFDSPFVCNCDHGWAEHVQQWELRTASALPAVLDDFGDPQLVKRGLEE